MEPATAELDIVWAPQPGPQKALVDCPLSEVFFGGARGGGKTDGVLGKWAIKGERLGSAFNAIFFRRELPMCDDAIERSQQIYSPLGWRYNAAKYTWRSPSGARIRFRPLERANDADKYQGQNVSDACVEEAGQYPDPRPIDRLHGVLRSPTGHGTQLLLTGNPGGAGQHWIRARYIDPAPHGLQILRRPISAGGRALEHRYVFIPSRVTDNRFLGDDYIVRLHLVGSEELVRAWLDGDWNAIEGAYFDCWNGGIHEIEPLELPSHWTRFRSLDWGSAKPFSVGWWAVASEDTQCSTGTIPRGAMVRYREWYGSDGTPNTGLKMTAEDVAKGILEREQGDKIAYGVADPSTFAQDGGPSIAEQMMRHGTDWRPGDNKRLPGWTQLRGRLVGDGDRPMLYVFRTCVDTIRTVPLLQHSEVKPEDLDTDAEDHAADEIRYACMSRPWSAPPPKPKQAPAGVQVTFNDLLKQARRQRLREARQ